MIHHWKGLDLEITDVYYHYDPTSSCEVMPSQTLNLKHVEIIKVAYKSTYDTSMERSRLGDYRF